MLRIFANPVVVVVISEGGICGKRVPTKLAKWKTTIEPTVNMNITYNKIDQYSLIEQSKIKITTISLIEQSVTKGVMTQMSKNFRKKPML